MELSREAYQIIVQNIGSKAGLCTLARVSKPFQFAAERALYNTLYMRDPETTVHLCKLLASRSRLATLVDALTVFASEGRTRDDLYERDNEDGPGDESEESSGEKQLPDDYWGSLSGALQSTSRLRFLNLHIDGDPAHAWILRGCPFKLRSFHCDLSWDQDLVSFLNTQDRLQDLYLADYAVISTLVDADVPEIKVHEPDSEPSPPGPPSSPPPTPTTQPGEQALPTVQYSVVHPVTTIDERALSALSTLECSFAEAFSTLAPGRPVARVKTCFSREDNPGKTRELTQLLESLQQSTCPVRCLDLADSSYTEEFSLTVLGEVSRRLPELRYLGTLVLPVGREVRNEFILNGRFPCRCPSSFNLYARSYPAPLPRRERHETYCRTPFQRLQFFGLLMRLRKLHTIELEVSEWDPAPLPHGLRALASEVRLYCPSIVCIVFVQEFERTVVRTINGFCAVDKDTITDNLWREL